MVLQSFHCFFVPDIFRIFLKVATTNITRVQPLLEVAMDMYINAFRQLAYIRQLLVTLFKSNTPNQNKLSNSNRYLTWLPGRPSESTTMETTAFDSEALSLDQ